VAGLSAACSLVDQGATPIILEPTPFPSHKVCGEFFSPECLPQLAKWGITFDHKIDNALFCSQNSSLRFSFSQPAGTMSHLAFDQKLLAYAQNKGAILIPEKVVAVRPNEVQTEKRVIPYSQLFIAAGRLPFFPSKSQPIYLGAKAYFSGLKLKAPLMMFSFSGCYVGITEVEKGVYNVALLSNQKELPTLDQLCAKDEGFRDVFEKGQKYPSPSEYFFYWRCIKRHPSCFWCRPFANTCIRNDGCRLCPSKRPRRFQKRMEKTAFYAN